MENLSKNEIEFTRINNDVNGNPRYVCHFLNLLNANERGYEYAGEQFDQNKPILNLDISEKYALAVRKSHEIGGRKFHNKQYGGGIVFQSYNNNDLAERINEIKNK